MEDKPQKISLAKLTKVWNPYESLIWAKVKTPITKEEIRFAIEEGRLISPDAPKNEYLIWDLTTREEHIERVAWLVVNWDENYPIEIDFGIPDMGAYFQFMDGNHRLAAALYLNKEYIYVNCSGVESEINRFIL